jgi:hypothetical protein
MTRIDSGAALSTWLQAEVAALGVQGKAATRAASQPRPVARDAVAVALARIRSIPADDPDRPRKALRVYLETTLLQAFGPQLALDGSFTQLLDAVQDRMAADPQIAAVAQRASRVLCGMPDEP